MHTVWSVVLLCHPCSGISINLNLSINTKCENKWLLKSTPIIGDKPPHVSFLVLRKGQMESLLQTLQNCVRNDYNAYRKVGYYYYG